MSRTKKLTLSAMVSALCVAVLALSNAIPRVSAALAALAGIFPAAAVIACGRIRGLVSAAAAGALALLLLPEKTAALWFCLLFGHYPVWKSLIERLPSRILRIALKLLGFYACAAVIYFVFQSAFTTAISADFGTERWTLALLAVILGLCFLLYDRAFSGLITFFIGRILPRIQK